MLADEIVTDTRLNPGDPSLVGQRGDRPATNQLGHLAGGALTGAQGREEGVGQAHGREVHLVVVVGRGQPLQVEDLRLSTLTVHRLEDADRVDDVEVDDEGLQRVKAGQRLGLETVTLPILVVDDDGSRVHLEESLDQRGSASSSDKSTLVVNDGVTIEETHLDCDGHWSSPVVRGRRRGCAPSLWVSL